jgi:predicted RNase H-like HicB family nuclease
MQIKINLEKTTDGFSAYAENYNVFAVGTDIKEITSNILQALNLYFEDQDQIISLSNIELVNDSTNNTL